MSIAILAYGSLVENPGLELTSLPDSRSPCMIRTSGFCWHSAVNRRVWPSGVARAAGPVRGGLELSRTIESRIVHENDTVVGANPLNSLKTNASTEPPEFTTESSEAQPGYCPGFRTFASADSGESVPLLNY